MYNVDLISVRELPLNMFSDPPLIRRGKSLIKVKEGDIIRIHCIVVGEPAPVAKWFVNDTEITDTKRFRIHATNSLK